MTYTIDKLSDIFKALSDKMRLRIFWVLNKALCEICVCEIIDAVEENQYNVSRHLRILKSAGLVNENKKGRFVYYSVSRTGDKISKIILNMFIAIPSESLPDDAKRLSKRLTMRKNGKCVVGMYGKKIK